MSSQHACSKQTVFNFRGAYYIIVFSYCKSIFFLAEQFYFSGVSFVSNRAKAMEVWSSFISNMQSFCNYNTQSLMALHKAFFPFV